MEQEYVLLKNNTNETTFKTIIDMLNLMEDIGYTAHEIELSNLLGKSELLIDTNHIVPDVISLLKRHMHNVFETYGVIINDDVFLLTIEDIYKILFSLNNIITMSLTDATVIDDIITAAIDDDETTGTLLLYNILKVFNPFLDFDTIYNIIDDIASDLFEDIKTIAQEVINKDILIESIPINKDTILLVDRDIFMQKLNTYDIFFTPNFISTILTDNVSYLSYKNNSNTLMTSIVKKLSFYKGELAFTDLTLHIKLAILEVGLLTIIDNIHDTDLETKVAEDIHERLSSFLTNEFNTLVYDTYDIYKESGFIDYLKTISKG